MGEILVLRLVGVLYFLIKSALAFLKQGFFKVPIPALNAGV